MTHGQQNIKFEERNVQQTINRRMSNCIGHIMRRNCPPKRVTEGKIEGVIEMTGRRKRRRRQLLDDLKEKEDTGSCKRKH
jgi:hypothetical protein